MELDPWVALANSCCRTAQAGPTCWSRVRTTTWVSNLSTASSAACTPFELAPRWASPASSGGRAQRRAADRCELRVLRDNLNPRHVEDTARPDYFVFGVT